MAKPILHQHAFWVYGVIVGLAIKESLAAALPGLLGLLTNPPNSLFASVPDAWKLLIFLIVIVRFYLGSAVYFHEHHNVDGELSTGYVTDFLSGIIHFILFFAWSLTYKISAPANHPFAPTAYETMLAIILLYDFLWWAICRGTARSSKVKYWAITNLVTVLISVVIHLIATAADALPSVAEGLTLIPVLVMSVVDLVGLAKDEELFAKWLSNFLPPKPSAP